MQASLRPTSKQATTTRSKLWTMGATAMLLSASLILAACGGGDDTAAPPVDDAVISTPVVDEAVVEEDAEATPEETTDEAADTESSEVVDSDTEVITDTDVTTQTEVFTETDVVTDVDVTTVTTDTVVTTETEEDTETETLTDSEVMTDTESDTDSAEVTDTEGMTDTEDATDTEGMTETEGMTGTGAAETTAAAAGAATAGAAMMGVSGVDNQYVRASTLLDYDFENTGGDVSGDLEDLLIDLSTGRVLFASIEYGGVLDLGDKDIVVPLNAFMVGPEGELVLNIDEAALENYPDVGNDWPDLNDPAWDDDVNTFWSETGIEGGTNFEEATTSVARASELMGHRIADLGAGAGSVLDILVNLGTGQAPYLIVDYGEGLDTDPYIIPVSAFDTAAWQDELVYGPDFTPDMLDNAPRFDQDAYPVGTPLDNDFGDSVESFWNDLGFHNDLNNDGEVD